MESDSGRDLEPVWEEVTVLPDPGESITFPIELEGDTLSGVCNIDGNRVGEDDDGET
ncbi:hypothetical protein HJG54_12755 [Leptolyngbya sp. NK1-12]|uniref:Uncharacterized protein n=1 Tax=Leptolyngbya sp. NK1-12 TaxID=2547451 RepID=A0AA96WEF4_9CYAN|nr:hypothetical protein [Leptolyngbya sp. NK1-12]WNZ23638.1 hypothetical protein HJG54_12755 [Leptolyngbya sp. NK1-12]